MALLILGEFGNWPRRSSARRYLYETTVIRSGEYNTPVIAPTSFALARSVAEGNGCNAPHFDSFQLAVGEEGD